MKTSLVHAMIFSSLIGLGCSGESSIRTGRPQGLSGSSDCEELVGPLNDGPGSCTDCYTELCVEVAASDELNFYIRVDDELEYETELCSVDDVVVTQSTNTLYDDGIAISAIELEAGLLLIATKEPLVTANPQAAVELTVAEGAYGRPTCE